MRHLARQQVGNLDRDADAGQVDRRRVEHPAHADGHVLLADVGFFQHELHKSRPFLLLLFQQFLDLLGRQQAVFDEGVGDAFSE